MEEKFRNILENMLEKKASLDEFCKTEPNMLRISIEKSIEKSGTVEYLIKVAYESK